MDIIFNYSIKITVFTLMMLVGADCTLQGLRDCLKKPWLTLNVGLGQFLIVPLLMYVCCYFTGASEEVTAGLILIACCPSGAISNTYCYLIKGNTSLSVSLTTISNLAAIVLMPLALAGVHEIAGTESSAILLIPNAFIVRELCLMMVLPILMGLCVRAMRPKWISGHQHSFRQLATVLVVSLILLIVGSGPETIVRHLKEIVLVTILFTIVLLGVAWSISKMLNLSTTDRRAVYFEFPCRNLAFATVVGITILNRPELVRFSAVLFLIQAVMLFTLFFIVNKQKIRQG